MLPWRLIDVNQQAMLKFAEAYKEYGDGAADEMGLAGEWAELHRKVKKLRRAMWDGDESYLTRESLTTVLQDLIGHALLALDMVERGIKNGR